MRPALLLLIALACVPAFSADKKVSKVVQPKVAKSPSEESRADRDRRLRRECQGRPNAGACAGYTR